MLKQKFIDFYFDVAEKAAELSTAERKKVGAVLVKNNKILSFGYNGTPPGWSNVCETTNEHGELVTKPEVIHAELNAIIHVCKTTETTEGAELFLTLSPCIECAKIIATAGIKNVYYLEEYRCDEGIRFLKQLGIFVRQKEDINRKFDLSDDNQ